MDGKPPLQAKRAAEIMGVAALYYCAAKLGLLTALPPGYVSAIWPPSGIALAAVLLAGNRIWPGIWLGSFLVNFTVSHDQSFFWLVSAAIATGSTLQALLGGWGIRRWLGPGNPFETSRTIFQFILIEALACVVAATIGVTALTASGAVTLKDFFYTWWTWWLGDLTGVLVLTPVPLCWGRNIVPAEIKGKISGSFISLLIPSAAAYFLFGGHLGNGAPLSFLLIPFMVWAAFRLNLSVFPLSVLFVSIMAISGTVRGHGPFAGLTFYDSLLILQMYVGVISIMGLIISVVLSERRRAENALQEICRGLEENVWERTRELSQATRALKAEEALQKQTQELVGEQRDLREAILRALSDAGEGVAVLDAQSQKFVYVNEALCRIYGYSEQELLNLGSFFQLVAPDELAIIRKRFEQRLRGENQERRYDTIIIHKSGRRISVEATVQEVQMGGRMRLAAVIRDISLRKRGESERAQRSMEMLLESELRYRKLVEWCPEPLLVQSGGFVVYANAAAFRVFGAKTPSDLIGKPSLDLAHPADVERVNARLYRLLNERQETEMEEFRYLRLDGETMHVEVSSIPITYKGQCAAQTAVRDITQRKKTEQELREKTDELADFMENASLPLHWVDPEGSILWANRAQLQMLGYSYQEYIGRRFVEFIEDPDAGEELMRLLASQGSVQNYEIRMRSKNGMSRQVLISSSGFWRDGKLAHVRCFSRDITERKLYEAELRKSKETAEEASSAKSQFLASMSHELRTPLNSIIGFTNILMKDNVKKGDIREYLSRIAVNGHHLLGLINDVLDLSKVESGRVEIKWEEVNLEVLISETVSQMEGQARADVMLSAEMPPSMATIKTDRDRLNQVLINLIGNAIKFTEKGSVKVKVHTDSGTGLPVRIDVTDTGIGIPSDKLKAIFDPFRQADESTARKYGGSGLGLSISKSLCQMMGYRLEVSSVLGSGSTFSIVLSAHAVPQLERQALIGIRRMGGPKLVGQVLDLFFTYAPQRVEAILEGEKEGDVKKVEKAAHSLRSSAGNVGASKLQELAKQIEKAASQEEKEKLRSLMPVLEETFGSVRNILNREKAAVAAQRRKVAVVEDNPDNRLLVRAMLGERYELEEYEDGPGAVAGIPNSKPDLILLDISLPGMDGIEVLSKIRGHDGLRDVPVVALTAHAMVGDREKYLSMGFDSYVSKPITEEKMLLEAMEEGFKKLSSVKGKTRSL